MILLLPNPPAELMDGNHASQYEELEKKAEGKIRAYGVSLDWRKKLEMVIETTGSRAIKVFFNAFYQEPRPRSADARNHHADGWGIIRVVQGSF